MLIFKYASIDQISYPNKVDSDAMKKHYIKTQQLLEDFFNLAWQVYESGYRPNYFIGVWRGGAPIGIAAQEFLDVLGIESDHIAIRTSSYAGIDQRSKKGQSPWAKLYNPQTRIRRFTVNCR
jgi:hypoxanthine phosphoribosyltransferase